MENEKHNRKVKQKYDDRVLKNCFENGDLFVGRYMDYFTFEWPQNVPHIQGLNILRTGI